MSLINVSIKHGRTMEEAQTHLEAAVHKVQSQFGALIRQAAWSDDRRQVRLDGIGFWVEMWVDAEEVHATGDLPVLGRLLGSPIGTGIKRILQQSFQKKLT